jgi:hypothetical protein
MAQQATMQAVSEKIAKPAAEAVAEGQQKIVALEQAVQLCAVLLAAV